LPLGEERSAALAARDEFGRCDYSDHLMLLRAFNAYSRTTQGARQLQRQLLVELRRLRMLPPNCNAFENADLNRYSSSWPMVQAAIVAGCYPGVGF
uniref:ATP-dependent RNA helicase DHX29 (inferred by orthology to a human protein) n=1 Tax=Anisakis simplex TaxID=6269 RepID=A0A0M3JPU4_ANISI